MNRMLTLLITAAFITAAAGCTPAAPPDITGLIYSVEGDSFLVVEGIDTADIAYDEWFEKGNNAIVFTVNSGTVLQKNGKKVAFEQLQKGQNVQVWSTGGLMKSYPLQGTAKKVVITD
jgi:hypothetical protein